MNTLILKTEKEFLDYLNNLSKKLGKSKSQIIMEAVLEYGEKLDKEKVHYKMQVLAQQLSKDKKYLKEINEYEMLSEDIIEER